MKKYSVELTEFAEEDLKIAKEFMINKQTFCGNYFIDSILVDLDSLIFYDGIHKKVYGFYRMLAKRFPYL